MIYKTLGATRARILRAELLESDERLDDCVACRTLLPGAPANDAEGEEGTGPTVGIADLLVTSNRVFK